MKNYKFIGKCVFFPKEKILVLGDVHIGYEEALNKQGMFVPRTQFDEIKKDLEKVFDETGKLKEIIILGDLKHEFGEISEQEWRETLQFIELLKEKSGKIVLVKGNHDSILEPIAKRHEIKIEQEYVLGENLFIHGNKFPLKIDKKIKRIFLGHRHPAVKLSDSVKSESFKVFLVGKWKGKEIIILPSFMPLIEGMDIINEEDSRLPFSISDFEVYAVGDKVYSFGKVGEIE